MMGIHPPPRHTQALPAPCPAAARSAGGVQIRRVKAGAAMLRFRGGTAAGGSRSYFWRSALDTAAWKVVTDRPTADFVAID